MSGWAIDLGTTNTGVAIWDDIAGRPRLLELTDICRVPDGEDQLEAPRLVPSATHVLPGDDFWTKVGRWPMMSRNFFMGQQAHIGRTAIEMNKGRITPNFTLMFKPYLGLDPLRILARAGKERFTARDICRIFLRELFANVKKTTGKRIRDLVVTTPVEAFESYRAEITEITRKLGVRSARLPIFETLGIKPTNSLNVNHMYEVLLVQSETHDWDTTLRQCLPQRLQRSAADNEARKRERAARREARLASFDSAASTAKRKSPAHNDRSASDSDAAEPDGKNEAGESHAEAVKKFKTQTG